MNIINIFVNKFITRPYIKLRLREVGRNFKFGYSSTLTNFKQFSIGKDFFSGPFCYFSTSKRAEIKIGSSVMFGPGCKVIGGNHNVKWLGGHMMYAPSNDSDKGIVIEDGVWFGANSIVLDGSYVSEGVVVAAGAIVTGYIPPYVVTMGVPAKIFKPRFDKRELEELLKNISSNYTSDEILRHYDLLNMEY